MIFTILFMVSLPLMTLAETLLNCDVTMYKGKGGDREQLGLIGSYENMDSIEKCFGKCLINPDCKSVTFPSKRQVCWVFKEAPTGADDPNLFDAAEMTTIVKNSCSESKPSEQVNCGKQASQYQPELNRFRRILGGSEAKPHSWPWQAYITMRMNAGGFACGSTLLSTGDPEKSDILLTAAHCVQMGSEIVLPESFEATLGDHDKFNFDEGEVPLKASKIIPHEEYQTGPFRNDIALVKLSRPVLFSDTIRPVCLPPVDAPTPVGKNCWAVGWGRTDSSDTTLNSPVLKQSKHDAHPDEKCQDMRGTYTEQFFCAGPLDGSSSVCNGDSGGGYLCEEGDQNWAIYGVASTVKGTQDRKAPYCNEQDAPPSFTRVSFYLPWIKQNMARLMK